MSTNSSNDNVGLSSKILKMRFMSRTKDEELKRKADQMDIGGDSKTKWKVDLSKLSLEKPKLKVQYDHNTIDQLKYKTEISNKLTYLSETHDSTEEQPSRMSFGGFNKKLEDQQNEVQDEIKNQPQVSDELMAKMMASKQSKRGLKSAKGKDKKRSEPY